MQAKHKNITYVAHLSLVRRNFDSRLFSVGPRQQEALFENDLIISLAVDTCPGTEPFISQLTPVLAVYCASFSYVMGRAAWHLAPFKTKFIDLMWCPVMHPNWFCFWVLLLQFDHNQRHLRLVLTVYDSPFWAG